MSLEPIHVVSDGTPLGTHVYDMNGREIEHLCEISWHIGAGEVATVELKFYISGLDAIGKTNALPITASTPLDAQE